MVAVQDGVFGLGGFEVEVDGASSDESGERVEVERGWRKMAMRQSAANRKRPADRLR